MVNNVSRVTLENGVDLWYFIFSQYDQASVTNFEKYLKEQVQSLPTKASLPISVGYLPKIDVTKKLDHQEAAYYQYVFVILRWIAKL